MLKDDVLSHFGSDPECTLEGDVMAHNTWAPLYRTGNPSAVEREFIKEHTGSMKAGHIKRRSAV